MNYNPLQIEEKWQSRWERDKIFNISQDIDFLYNKSKFYVLDMFPYPSGAGLHVGHPEGYTATDVLARLKRLQGFNVMYAMGWDAFGLPAERAAIRSDTHPSIVTKFNINNFRVQIKRLGLSYDWSREINTTNKNYYKWTQWIFLKLVEKNLAYLIEAPVNWCPALNTVLANEEICDGKYIETGDSIEVRIMSQWMLSITTYAERLLNDLNDLEWPDSIKQMQKNWIGKAVGFEIFCTIKNSVDLLAIFTFHPESILGSTFCVISSKHSICSKINKFNSIHQEFFTGLYALHPITQTEIPIWCSDYFRSNYSAEAIFGNPAENKEDNDFAQRHALLIKNYKLLDKSDLPGVKKTVYKLHDWLFSRQRYWGEPIPVIRSNFGNGYFPLKSDDLPLTLPDLDSFKFIDEGLSPLNRASLEWLKPFPEDNDSRRDTNTMPQWAGSCWYYLRYLDPINKTKLCASEFERYWMPVDLYIGGTEHAVLHLLYARFWHKVLFDCGVVSTKEPFLKLFNQGMILAHSYKDITGRYYSPSNVEFKDNHYYCKDSSIEVFRKLEKMSKSRLNVVNPNEIIDKYGADALRLYELFMGPLDQVKPWQTAGIEGLHRFLNKVWRLAHRDLSPVSEILNPQLWDLLQKTLLVVEEHTIELRYNTAISQMMIFVNFATKEQKLPKEVVLIFLQILSPYAPHICEELWEFLGQRSYISKTSWPKLETVSFKGNDKISVVVQINGKRRCEISVSSGLVKSELVKIASEHSVVKNILGSRLLLKTIVIANKIVNFVLE